MNCETADNLLLDELYGELDEATSAELRRHGDECGACGVKEQLAAMKKTREAAAPEYVEPPADLEDRILAATREIAAPVPLHARSSRSVRSRAGNLVSLAGAWAMRPQTAMAAVFLLMIGSSLTFLKTHHSKSAASSSVAVSEQGSPSFWNSEAANSNAAQNSSTALGGKLAGMVGGSAPAAASATSGLGDDTSGDTSVAAAHHASPAEAKDSPPPPSPAIVAMNTPLAPDSVTKKSRGVTLDDEYSSDPSSPTAHRMSGPRQDKVAVLKPSPDPSPGGLYGQNAFDAPAATNAPPAAAAAPMTVGPKSMAPPADLSAASAAAASGAAGGADATADPVSAGKALYNAGKYADALAQFDSVASGDVNAALWAARAAKRASGCGAAVGRFDDVAARAPSSTTGYDAKLEAGRCYRTMGDADSARARLNPLLTVPSHMDRAKAELAALSARSGASRPAATKAGPSAY